MKRLFFIVIVAIELLGSDKNIQDVQLRQQGIIRQHYAQILKRESVSPEYLKEITYRAFRYLHAGVAEKLTADTSLEGLTSDTPAKTKDIQDLLQALQKIKNK
jgi:hypothetical protein